MLKQSIREVREVSEVTEVTEVHAATGINVGENVFHRVTHLAKIPKG